jgi:hypothetical protein
LDIIPTLYPLSFKIGTICSINIVFPEPTGPPIPMRGIREIDTEN